MDACIESILKCGDDIEVVIVDDGSTKDDTPAKADAWAAERPDVVRVVHQENGGHGQAVNTGLANASGLYFKAVSYTHLLRRVLRGAGGGGQPAPPGGQPGQ